MSDTPRWQLTVSWSEIDAYRQCPFKHHLNYLERWTPPSESPALARGTAWHKVMELWYDALRQAGPPGKRREHVVTQAFEHLMNKHLQAPDLEQSAQQELLAWMFAGYVENYLDDPLWRIESTEGKTDLILPCPDDEPLLGPDDEAIVVILKAKIDLLISVRQARVGWRMWVVDHKSAANLASSKELDLDDQFALYIWLLRHAGHNVAGAIYNGARTQRNKGYMPMESRFQRQFLSRTNAELDTIAAEAYASVRKAWQPYIRRLGTEYEGQPQERNPNTDTCKWRCPYLEPCLGSRRGVDRIHMLESRGFKRSNYTNLVKVMA